MKKDNNINVLVFSGYGLNCEEEAAYGFTLAGAKADIVHINDIIDGRVKMDRYHILVLPGGFAYGDDTGAGKAYANRIRNHLSKPLEKFLKDGKLVLAICNGFQVATHLGILPGALTFNDNNRYTDRWVDMKVSSTSPWLTGIETISCPIAHGEGKFYAEPETLAAMKKEKAVALTYIKGEMAKYQDLSANPNGSLGNIAGVTAYEGRVLGMMPHPDRALFPTQLPNWGTKKGKLSKHGPGLQIFKNGVAYMLKSRHE